MSFPILPILYFATILSVFGTGYYCGWRGEYEEVVRLELQLNDINTQSQKLFADAQKHNEGLATQQQEAITELENKYHDSIETNDSLHDQLVDAQRVRRTADSATSDCRSVSKVGDSTRNQKNDVGRRSVGKVDTAGFSERLDSFVSGKAWEADKLDSERRLLLDWVKTIPSEMTQ